MASRPPRPASPWTSSVGAACIVVALTTWVISDTALPSGTTTSTLTVSAPPRRRIVHALPSPLPSAAGRAAAHRAVAVEATTREPLRVACVGDSLTRGDRDPNATHAARKWALVGNYPMRLQEKLGSRFTVQNFGRGGASLLSGSGFSYWDTTELAAALDYNPHLAIVMLGTNDARLPVWRDPDLAAKVAPATQLLKDDTARLLHRFRTLSNAPAIVLVTPPPLLEPGSEDARTRHVLPALRAGFAEAASAALEGSVEPRAELAALRRNACAPLALSMMHADAIVSAKPRNYLPDRVHLAWRATNYLADGVAAHLRECNPRRRRSPKTG